MTNRLLYTVSLDIPGTTFIATGCNMDDVVKWCLDSHDGPSAVARVTILEDVAWTVCYKVLLLWMDMTFSLHTLHIWVVELLE